MKSKKLVSIKAFLLLPLLFTSIVFGYDFKVPSNEILLAIGQDLGSILDYKNCGCFPEPGGVVTYTDINLNGLYNDANWGAGLINGKKLAEEFPNSIIVIGLYMVNKLDGILAGIYDENIDTLANFINEVRRPVLVRIGYEFDGIWNNYDPEKYKMTFRYIVEKLRTKTKYFYSVWQSCASPMDVVIRGYIVDISWWYPGDEYVDYVGLSWFLKPSEKPKVSYNFYVPTQKELAERVVEFARKQNKPVMVCESAPQGYSLSELTESNISPIWDGPAGQGAVKKTAEQIWSEWFKPFFDFIYENSDVIRIVTYINADWDSQKMWGPPYNSGYWGDSRVQVNDAIQNMWLSEITKTIWYRSEVGK